MDYKATLALICAAGTISNVLTLIFFISNKKSRWELLKLDLSLWTPVFSFCHVASSALGFVQVLSFLRRKEGFLSLVLKHIDTSAMMDVLLRLISCVEPPPLRLDTLTVWDPHSYLYTLHTDIVCSFNVVFFSTVAEWREACTETHRAHSPWERWWGKRALQYFYINK